MQRKLASGIIVIFGASGDLTKRKLIPAIFSLYSQNIITIKNLVLGVARSEFSDDGFRETIINTLSNQYPYQDKKIKKFSRQLFYQPINDYTNSPVCYQQVQKRIKNLQQSYNIENNLLFYLSIPPELYYVIPLQLANMGMNLETNGYKRIVLEKPFGTDELSAQRLSLHLLDYYQESQLFRIDHYLGKEAVQNLFAFRFANVIFDSLWNAAHIENIQIYANESIGVGQRAGFYEKSGAIRDMIQSHLLQLLAIIAMETPAKMNGQAISNEILRLLKSIRHFTTKKSIENNVIIGQYKQGFIQNKIKLGYRDELGIDKNSLTETYAAIIFFVDNKRWCNVPFYLRTGKRLKHRVSEVVINFKPIPNPFSSTIQKIVQLNNQLIIRIQPDEGIKMNFAAKKPGSGFKLHEVNMGFHYSDFFQEHSIINAYDRLILDALEGNNILFSRHDVVEVCWHIIDPILHYLQKHRTRLLHFYPSGSYGPIAADKMLEKQDHKWRNPSTFFKEDLMEQKKLKKTRK